MAEYWDQTVLDELVGRLKANELYLFAGAGLSCLAGYPTWTKLLGDFAEKYRSTLTKDPLIEQELDCLIKTKDLSLVTHLLSCGNPGEDAFVEVLRHHFQTENTTETHKRLLGMPFAGYLTINYDNCFEVALQSSHSLVNNRWFCFPKHKKTQNNNIKELYNGDQFLLHMHGCFLHKKKIDSENIILTKEQYTKFYKDQSLKKIYDDLFCHSMLLLGTSFTDPYFLQELNKVRGHHNRDNRAERKTCYLVLPKSEKPETEHCTEVEYGLKFCYFDDTDQYALQNMVRELYEVSHGTVIQECEVNEGMPVK